MNVLVSMTAMPMPNAQINLVHINASVWMVILEMERHVMVRFSIYYYAIAFGIVIQPFSCGIFL